MENISVLQNFTPDCLRTDPYNYICIENALPQDIYDKLDAEYPKDTILEHAKGVDNDTCYRLNASLAIQDNLLQGVWKDFYEYHTSNEFYNSMVDIFWQLIPENLQKDLRGKTSVRTKGRGPTSLVTDCQAVIHQPIAGSTRTPHVDNPIEIYAGLFYMKRADDTTTGGDFNIHKVTTNDFSVVKKDGRSVPTNILDTITETITYKANTFCCFLNLPGSVHSVTPRTPMPTVERRSVNIIAEFNAKIGKKMYNQSLI